MLTTSTGWFETILARGQAFRLLSLARAVPFISNWWPNKRLTLEPFDQFGFEYTGGGKRRDPSQWQPVVFGQTFYRILTQSKKLCDFQQLQPSIRTTCHRIIS